MSLIGRYIRSRRQQLAPAPLPSVKIDDDDRWALPPSRDVEIGEIRVDIRPTWCCGMLVWYGRFSDGSTCCEYAVHGTADEAEACARDRVAQGFVVREVDR